MSDKIDPIQPEMENLTLMIDRIEESANGNCIIRLFSIEKSPASEYRSAAMLSLEVTTQEAENWRKVMRCSKGSRNLRREICFFWFSIHLEK